MTAFLEKKGGLAVLIAAAGALMAFVSLTPAAGRGGSLLLAFLFFVAVVEGCIAAAAAGATVNARWVGAVRKELLSVTPLLLLAAFLLLLLIPFVDSYPWAGKPGIWLRKDFFIGRNLVFLLLAYVTARRFAAAPADGEGTKSRAAWYLLVFVVSQTLTAFDLVMSLEYPWISALLGGYFFIESIYGGFAVAALLCLLFRGTPPADRGHGSRSDLSDLSILMFGFSIMWAGLFFAQYPHHLVREPPRGGRLPRKEVVRVPAARTLRRGPLPPLLHPLPGAPVHPGEIEPVRGLRRGPLHPVGDPGRAVRLPGPRGPVLPGRAGGRLRLPPPPVRRRRVQGFEGGLP